MAYEFQGQTAARRAEGRRQPARAARERPSRDRSLLQIFAAVVGAAFVLAGVGGFIPGITTNYDELSLLGTDSEAELLGLFRVSVVHNIVHLAFGIGLLAAARASWSALFLIGGGLGYGAVTVYGVFVDRSSDANFLPINHADNILHLGLSTGMVLLGLIGLAASRRGR